MAYIYTVFNILQNNLHHNYHEGSKIPNLQMKIEVENC